jgi:hypothetical protein
LLQARKHLNVIDEKRKLALLLAGKNLDVNGRQFFLEFRSETRCAGLVSSGCAIQNLHFHRPDPFSSG